MLQDYLDLNWQAIKPHALKPMLTKLIADYEKLCAEVFLQESPTWSNSFAKLHKDESILMQVWSMASHLKQVKFNHEWREAYPELLSIMTEFSLNRSLDKNCNQAVLSLLKQPQSGPQDRALKLMQRDFALAGVNLSEDKTKQLRKIKTELSTIANQISINVLDSTDAWSLHITDEVELKGVPSLIKSVAQSRAKSKGLSGWCVSIEDADYVAIMQSAENQNLREKVFKAYRNRASDLSDNKFDNGDLMVRTLSLRLSQAQILGFAYYADYALATRAAESAEAVTQLLDDLAQYAKPKALQEWQELRAFANNLGYADVKPWDIAFIAHKYEEEQLGVNPNDYRPYFPLAKVLEGLSTVVERLFNLRVKQVKRQSWDENVVCWQIVDNDHDIEALCFMDLFARAGKSGGAWMDDCKTRWRSESGDLHQPVAFLTCNFTQPTDTDSLLTHNEVLTLFHEFGHTLNHCLSQTDISDISGINGVAWDAVEVASQLLEHWAWTKEGLGLVSEHIETKKSLPDNMIKSLHSSREFMASTALMRQIAFARFDWHLHTSKPYQNAAEIYAVYQKIMQDNTASPVWDKDRMPAAFTHIFAGGYAAGYYSYLFSEVMADDAFTLFLEEGLFANKIGERLKNTIYSQGGYIPALELFKRFRGREPDVKALLKFKGIIS